MVLYVWEVRGWSNMWWFRGGFDGGVAKASLALTAPHTSVTFGAAQAREGTTQNYIETFK